MCILVENTLFALGFLVVQDISIGIHTNYIRPK